MTSLRLQNLSKEYETGKPVIENLDLQVREGELLALLGPSGCGKTTLLRLIAGLLKPTFGDILFDGQSILKLPPEKRGAVMVFQDHAVFPFMTVAENVAFGLKMRKIGRAEINQRVKDALRSVHLKGYENRLATELSGGQQQRVALARALIIRPQVLLLDEPLSNLELSLREELRKEIRRLQEEIGITSIFVTHDQDEAVVMADRIALLLAGRIHQVGPPRSFFENPKDVDVARFFGASNIYAGAKNGQRVQSPLGELEILPCGLPDGQVSIAIRPEAVEIGPNGHNNIPARLISYDYKGSKAYCQFLVSDQKLSVAAQPYKDFQIGDMLTLHFPKDRISLMP